MLDLDDLLSYLYYKDGGLYWKKRTSYMCILNERACHITWNGYRLITFKGSTYREYHLVWFIFNKELPRKGLDIDHIDGDRSNNRIENLRLCIRSQNLANKSGYGKTSRHRGVYKNTCGDGYSVKIKREYLGTYASEDEAAMVWNKRASEIYGDFAKLNDV